MPKTLDVFVSFRVNESLAEARQLKEALGKKGISAFVSQDDIKPGQQWSDVIANNLDNAKVLVALATSTYGAPGTAEQGTYEELLIARDSDNGVKLVVAKMADKWTEMRTHMVLTGQECLRWDVGTPVPEALISAISETLG